MRKGGEISTSHRTIQTCSRSRALWDAILNRVLTIICPLSNSLLASIISCNAYRRKPSGNMTKPILKLVSFKNIKAKIQIEKRADLGGFSDTITDPKYNHWNKNKSGEKKKPCSPFRCSFKYR